MRPARWIGAGLKTIHDFRLRGLRAQPAEAGFATFQPRL